MRMNKSAEAFRGRTLELTGAIGGAGGETIQADGADSSTTIVHWTVRGGLGVSTLYGGAGQGFLQDTESGNDILAKSGPPAGDKGEQRKRVDRELMWKNGRTLETAKEPPLSRRASSFLWLPLLIATLVFPPSHASGKDPGTEGSLRRPPVQLTQPEPPTTAAHREPLRQFRIARGAGLPVCKAYSQLLDRIPLYTATPFCDRPDYGPALGFEPLERMYLTVPEIERLFGQVHAFMDFGDPNYPDSIGLAESRDDAGIKQFMSWHWISAWRYSAPIDIGNNGKPVNIVVWRGYGAADKGGACSSYGPAGKPWDFPYMQQRAFILRDNVMSIDATQTRAIFGNKVSASMISRRADRSPPGGHPFRPLADSIGVFRFRDKYYIDAAEIPPSENAKAPVAVFLREHGLTREICAFQEIR